MFGARLAGDKPVRGLVGVTNRERSVARGGLRIFFVVFYTLTRVALLCRPRGGLAARARVDDGAFVALAVDGTDAEEVIVF